MEFRTDQPASLELCGTCLGIQCMLLLRMVLHGKAELLGIMVLTGQGLSQLTSQVLSDFRGLAMDIVKLKMG